MTVYLKLFFFTSLKLRFTFNQTGKNWTKSVSQAKSVLFFYLLNRKITYWTFFLLLSLGSKVQYRKSQRKPSTSNFHISLQHSQAGIIALFRTSLWHLGSPHFSALHPPAHLCTHNVRGVRVNFLKKRDGWRTGKQYFAQLALPLADATCLHIVFQLRIALAL